MIKWIKCKLLNIHNFLPVITMHYVTPCCGKQLDMVDYRKHCMECGVRYISGDGESWVKSP